MKVDLRLQKLKLGQMLRLSPRVVASTGLIDGRALLTGTGNSITDLAAKSNGQIVATMAKGKLSNLLDAVVELTGGKVIRLLVGDEQIAVRCGIGVLACANARVARRSSSSTRNRRASMPSAALTSIGNTST